MLEIVVPSVFASYFGLLILSFVIRSSALNWISAVRQTSAEFSHGQEAVFEGKTARFAVLRVPIKD
jgi:hypothetical protein